VIFVVLGLEDVDAPTQADDVSYARGQTAAGMHLGGCRGDTVDTGLTGFVIT
jgi:hypothetical protein